MAGLECISDEFDEFLVRHRAAAWEYHASSLSQGGYAKVLEHIEPISRREDGLRNDAAMARSLSRYPLERFNVPTLVMSVEDDLFNTYASARYTAAHIPGARFIGYPTGGHLEVGHQQEVWSEVMKFLRNARAVDSG